MSVSKYTGEREGPWLSIVRNGAVNGERGTILWGWCRVPEPGTTEKWDQVEPPLLGDSPPMLEGFRDKVRSYLGVFNIDLGFVVDKPRWQSRP